MVSSVYFWFCCIYRQHFRKPTKVERKTNDSKKTRRKNRHIHSTHRTFESVAPIKTLHRLNSLRENGKNKELPKEIKIKLKK